VEEDIGGRTTMGGGRRWDDDVEEAHTPPCLSVALSSAQVPESGLCEDCTRPTDSETQPQSLWGG
jgi:hypothetical protein